MDHHRGLSVALVSFIQSLLRTSLFLNGGAIIAALSLYGALTEKPSVTWALGLWSFGLLLSAAAGFCIAKAQREFQVMAGHTAQRMAKGFFSLEIPGQPAIPADNAKEGHHLRQAFWCLWGGSILAFTTGAGMAICQLA